MKTVLLDPSGSPAAGCALASQTPPHLVDRHVILATVLRPRQLECSGDRCAASTDDSDLDRLLAPHHVTPDRCWLRPQLAAGLYQLCRRLSCGAFSGARAS